MPKTIAVSGKGGTGKTTLISLMIRSLIDMSTRPVLAVDADANACLGITLGVEPEGTVADLRDSVMEQKPEVSGGIGRLQSFGMQCHQLLTECKGYDLLTMGRPEGPKCYCAVNNVLRGFLNELGSSYAYIITDNEAGMEHLSRRTTNNIDLLMIVGEPTKIGIITARRIVELTDSLPISISETGIIWNRTNGSVEVDTNGIEVFGTVPYDQEIYDAAIAGKNVFELDKDNAALKTVREILQRKLGM